MTGQRSLTFDPVYMRGVRFGLLMALAFGCGDNPADPGSTTGGLIVNVLGLPAGAPAAITVTGPSGFSQSVVATTTISDLEPGSYTVTASNVTVTESRYDALPATQSVTVAASATPTASTVQYALATGALTITVSGLPTGVNGAVTVTGPLQFNRQLTATTTITALNPGTYTITAAEVSSAEDRYAASAPVQAVTVNIGLTPATASVDYALFSGRLTVTIGGLPAGFSSSQNDPLAVNAAVSVTGPDGFSRLLTATTLLTQLTPGNYTVTAANVVNAGITFRAVQPSQTVIVPPSTTPATALVSYVAIDGALSITVSGLPAGVNAAITVTGPAGYSQSVTGTTLLPALTTGAYTISAANVVSGASTYAPTPASQAASVTVGASTSAEVLYEVPIVLRLAAVATGLDRPVQLLSPNADSRLFVVEQTGRIRIIQNGQVVAQPFLDLAARILPVNAASDEYGLLGLAFHPQYSSNGTFFVLYMDLSQDLVVEKYQVSANPNVANTTGTLVLRIPHRVHTTNNGGGMLFGPDGFLYIAMGDGGCCGDPLQAAQNLNSMLGKILRIDVSGTPYGIPSTNPFAGQPERAGEIWAYGLRNPWRIDIDPVTGTLYIADVGEDDREEVNALPLANGGANYGWSILEGTRCVLAPCSSQGTRLPVLEYLHGEGCSVTGGGVYRGTQIPEIVGHYLYSDYCAGFLRSFLLVQGVATRQKDWNIAPPGFVTSFGRDNTGEMYVLTQAGEVFRIVKQ